MATTLTALSDELASVVERVGQYVVSVHARPRFESSGVHWRPGVVITAEHTIRRDEEIRITAPDGQKYEAELAGRDPGTDLAVLRVKGLNAQVAPAAGGIDIRPGSLALAVGRLKDSTTAAFGIISSISGPSQTWRGGRLDQIIRLDLATHPGASGGAAVNAAGNLFGIVTGALSRVSVFAIPLSTVERVTERLLSCGHIARGYLGVGLQPIPMPEHLRTKFNVASDRALIAVSVDPESPAGHAGMLIGDILLQLDRTPVKDAGNIQEALDSESIGKQVRALILRGGETRELQVVVGERPRR